MKMVCGQTHPQKRRPNAAVNKMINTTNVTIVSPKMKKSCGQNTLPNKMNLALGTLKRNKRLPVHINKWQGKKECKEKPTHITADIIKPAR